jgi:hypothetical protein
MRDTFQLVPPEIRAMVEAEEWRDRQAKAGRAISEALTALHPDLSLVFVRHDAVPDALPPGAVPGRWHVRKKGPIPFFAPITTPDGGYREPDARVVMEMAERDMRRPEVAQRVFTRGEREAAKRRKDRALRKEQERDVLKEDLKAGWRVPGRIYRDDGQMVKRKRA